MHRQRGSLSLHLTQQGRLVRSAHPEVGTVTAFCLSRGPRNTKDLFGQVSPISRAHVDVGRKEIAARL